MQKIVIKNLDHKTIYFQVGEGPVLQILLKNQIDWMHACGGKGRCTTCSMVVDQGEDKLSEDTPAEKKYREAGRLPEHVKLACQTSCSGDIEISVPEMYKLHHLSYSD